MLKIFAVVAFAASLSACDLFNSVSEMFKYSRAVEDELEQSIGLRPQVGFNSHNKRLVSVTVQFPNLFDKKPLGELGKAVSASVSRQFKQKPDAVVLSFVVKDNDASRTADARGLDSERIQFSR